MFVGVIFVFPWVATELIVFVHSGAIVGTGLIWYIVPPGVFLMIVIAIGLELGCGLQVVGSPV